jgi:hypothetical protein
MVARNGRPQGFHDLLAAFSTTVVGVHSVFPDRFWKENSRKYMSRAGSLRVAVIGNPGFAVASHFGTDQY